MPGKRGWPKGKPRGPLTEERKKKLRAGRVRSGYRKKLREVEMASGFNLGSGNNFGHGETQVLVDTSPAAWLRKEHHIGDCEYVNGGLDELMMRALHDRIVYAGSACCHHECVLQEVTIDVIAAVEKTARKNKRKPITGLPKGLKPERPIVKIRKIMPAVVLAAPMEREGEPLTAVVKELFSREGKPLLEVVSELFDP